MDIRDIAAKSGYGVGTVSRVINDQPNVSDRARERILAVMEELGYEPNSNARYLKMRSQTPVAAFVMGVNNRLFGDILERIQAALAAQEEDLAVTYLADDAEEVRTAIRYQQTRRPKGMLFLGGEPRYFRESFGEIEVPSVLVTNVVDGLDFPNLSSVSIDNVAASHDMVEHLWGLGHRRIGVIGGNPERELISARRLAGVEEALLAHGVTLDRARDYEPSGYSESGGYEAARTLLTRSPDLTAIFSLGDAVAFGAVRAIADLGLSVPGDVSITGFDDTTFSQFSVPRITTVRQDADRLAESAVRILLDGMRSGAAAVHEVVPYEIARRESVRAIEG